MQCSAGCPRTVFILLSLKPVRGPSDDGWIDRMHSGHVREFQDPVSGQANVSRRLAEPFKPSPGHFEREQTLVSVVYASMGFGSEFRFEQAHRFEEVERQNVRISGRGGLLEAAVRFLEN